MTPVTVNFNRGLKGMLEGIAKRIGGPNAVQFLDGGFRDVIHRAVDQSGVPAQDFTLVDAAERIGVLKPQAKRRKQA